MVIVLEQDRRDREGAIVERGGARRQTRALVGVLVVVGHRFEVVLEKGEGELGPAARDDGEQIAIARRRLDQPLDELHERGGGGARDGEIGLGLVGAQRRGERGRGGADADATGAGAARERERARKERRECRWSHSWDLGTRLARVQYVRKRWLRRIG